MNCSFENIFEKYNLNRETPRKRHRSTKTQTSKSQKKKLPILSKTEAGSSMACSVPNTNKQFNFRSSCYLNNHAKAKYHIPTRYNRLEIVKIRTKAKNRNCTFAEYIPLVNSDHKGHSKENAKKFASFEEKGQTNDHKADVSKTKAALASIGNINDVKRKIFDGLKISDNNYESKNELDAPLEIDETRSISVAEKSFYKSSDSKNIEDFTSQVAPNCSSELDLLIDLIEQETQNNRKDNIINKQNRKVFNSDERLLITKPRLKGGCQEMFERSLKHAKAKSNFLKHDKKVGLRIGQVFSVFRIDNFHGITLATVKSQDLNKFFAVVVTKEMAPRLKLGSLIEAFFDDSTVPYKLLLNREYFEVYLEPYKLLMS